MTLAQFGYWVFGVGWLVLFVLVYVEICQAIDEAQQRERELGPVLRSGAIQKVK